MQNLLSNNSIYDEFFLERKLMLSFNPNLVLKMPTRSAEITFVQIKASNLGLQGILQAVKALSLITLRGLMS